MRHKAIVLAAALTLGVGATAAEAQDKQVNLKRGVYQAGCSPGRQIHRGGPKKILQAACD